MDIYTGLSATPNPNSPGVRAWPVTVRVVMRVRINIDWGLINPKLYYLDWGVWHVVPLGDVGQHTLPCSVKSVPSNREKPRTVGLDLPGICVLSTYSSGE